MKYLILFLLVGILLFSCGKYPQEEVYYEYAIPDSNKVKASNFIIEVCSASNPQSDEEPEDMIIQAEKTATKLYGVKTIGIRFYSCSGCMSNFIPYWDLSDRQKTMCDNYLKRGNQ